MQREKYSFERLKNYAEWYYFRYYPSDAKLLQKLSEKGNSADAQKIYENMQEFLIEDKTLEVLIESYIYKNKNYSYIKSKMQEKLFPSQKVQKYLEKYKQSGESLMKKEYVLRKIEKFLQKGKSRQYIFQKLGETKEDKKLLEDIFNIYFLTGEDEALRKEYEKIKGKYDKQKIIQKLCTKGFQYDNIKKILQDE